ncbi:Heat shock factor 2-binding protein [Varanus komodoensis]|nr:Heat shock factor 2-binding protein [Varanus komodoensis]
MSAAGTGELQFIEGTMNTNMYYDILKQSMIPSLWRLGRRAVFQHDNNPKHASKMTTALLKKLRVKMMDWPSMSPDLNPIEQLWGILKWKVEERKVSNIHQLRDVVMEEWKRTPVATCEALKAEMEGEFVKVRKRALERLTTEVMQMHDILPKILNGDIIENFQKLDAVEAIVEKKDLELEQLRMDCEHYKARFEAAQADCMKERKGKITAIQQLHEAKQQLLQQAEYCTEMGAAVCTLLWSVSSNEDAVKTILGSSKAVKFFNIAGQTMESFVRSLTEDMKQQDLDSDESQFVLGLAGIITNVAALACGREFLINSSQVLLDTTMQLLGDMKPGCCTKLKVYED